jgi:hypothetical protein
MLVGIVRPFIPKDIMDSIEINSGFDCDKMIRPFIDNSNIPKYLGGELVGEDEDPYCKNRLAPIGPFLADKGESIFAKIQY